MGSSPIDSVNTQTEPSPSAESMLPQPVVTSAADLKRMIFLISVGLFITAAGQPGVIGALPFRFLFKNQFHWNAAQQANFFAVASLPDTF